ncbi:phospholipase D family protein [Terribacillus goriensis]|uniref:phospholipase D-like domain-containing protein n=1 Tax=Terribacillus saccharophilus TaxID=361277 RepID=UPI003982D783
MVNYSYKRKFIVSIRGVIMEISFLGQGLNEHSRPVGDVLIESFQDDRYSRFFSSVAFVTEGGVNRILEAYDNFSSTNEKSSVMFVGVDQKGTPKDALDLLLSLGHEVYVYHNTNSNVIYHPKLYLFEGDEHFRVIIGSSNLTVTGLFRNVETSILIEFDAGDEEGLEFLNEINSFYSSFLNNNNPNVQRLTEEIIERLVSNSIVPRRFEHSNVHKKTGDGSRSEGNELEDIFPDSGAPPEPGRNNSSARHHTRPTSGSSTTIPGTGPSTGGSSLALGTSPSTGSSATLTGFPMATVLSRTMNLVWRKSNLPRTDAQFIPPGLRRTNVTGNLRLAQAGFEVGGSRIDVNTYFRHDIFGGLTWSRRIRGGGRAPLEIAEGEFYLRIFGTWFGSYNLEISHDLNRVSGQNNIPTILHWGTALRAVTSINITGHRLDMYQIPSLNAYFIDIQ